jgi:hypothetical protein
MAPASKSQRREEFVPVRSWMKATEQDATEPVGLYRSRRAGGG